MLRVYIGGPYSADNVIDVLENIRRGNQLAADVLKSGFAPFSPWLDFLLSFHRKITVEEYYAYSMAWLEVSDAVLLVRGWQRSKGTAAELKRASELGIPVFQYLYELENWAIKREISLRTEKE